MVKAVGFKSVFKISLYNPCRTIQYKLILNTYLTVAKLAWFQLPCNT